LEFSWSILSLDQEKQRRERKERIKKEEQDLVATMRSFVGIDFHVWFPFYLWNAWLCMCVLGSLVVIGMGFSMHGNVF